MTKEGDARNEAPPEGSTTGAPDPSPEKEPPTSSEWESRFKYLLADFDNFRRRTERERTRIRAEAEAHLLRRLIPLVEGFQNAEAAAKSLPISDPLRRGLELLRHELDAALRPVGFAPVARIGEAFRPEEHEAVGEADGPQNIAEGQVAEIVQQGYRFQGGLLRPAKVLVARSAKEGQAPPASPSGSGSADDSSFPVEEGPI